MRKYIWLLAVCSNWALLSQKLENCRNLTVSQSCQSFTMATVIVVGCGIIGPVMAIMLKDKGYNPVIVEKVKHSGDAGLSFAMWPNGYHRPACKDCTTDSEPA